MKHPAVSVARRVKGLERINVSVNGNPAWRFYFTDGSVARTAPDASIAFEVTPSWEGSYVLLEFNEDGQIVDVVVQP